MDWSRIWRVISLPQAFVMSDGSCPEQRRQCVASRPSRRLVLVPRPAGATPQSIQDREWDAGVETHNRFSPLQDTQLEGMPIVGVSGSDTESDVPSRRRRHRVVWNADPHSEAQTTLTLLQVLARLVGAVPVGAPVAVASRHHRWSPLFVPLLWGAAGVDATTPVSDMLVSTASVVSEPIQFHGSDIPATEAVRVGWTALRAVLRTWWVHTQLQLSNWLRRQGFAANRLGHHILARAQERTLSQACEVHARVAILETVFVSTVLHLGRLSGIPPVIRDRAPEVRRIRQVIPSTVPSASWAQREKVILQDWFAKRCPMLKTCPHFMRGRLRQCG